MRIVGGVLSGRRFAGPPGDATRPTAERVREALASALHSRNAISGATVLDLWAGTGALAFEALSRGALRAVCVERDRRVAEAIVKSAKELGLEDRVTVVGRALDATPSRAVLEALARVAGGFGLVFADPPYDDIAMVGPLLAALGAAKVIAAGAMVVVEHSVRTPPTLGDLAIVATYRYGDTGVTLVRTPDSP